MNTELHKKAEAMLYKHLSPIGGVELRKNHGLNAAVFIALQEMYNLALQDNKEEIERAKQEQVMSGEVEVAFREGHKKGWLRCADGHSGWENHDTEIYLSSHPSPAPQENHDPENAGITMAKYTGAYQQYKK
jgi:hypothetical protein